MPNWKKVIISGSDAALNSLEITSHLTASGLIYPTADGEENQSIITDGTGNLSFGNPSAGYVQIAVKNVSGGLLVKGTPVFITGSVGASATVEIDASDASDASKMPAVGVLSSDLTHNSQGFATTNGFLRNITTDPIDGVTPDPNDTIYIKVGGGLTLTKPTGSVNLIQNIGKVGKVSSGGAGSIIVSSILRTNDIPNLPEGKIWVGDGNTVVSSLVHLDEAQNFMGVDTATPNFVLDVNGEINAAQDGYFIDSEGIAILASGELILGDWDGNGYETTIHSSTHKLATFITDTLTVDGHISGSGNVNIDGDVTASAFVGDGSALTNVTAEWDGSHNGNAEITGSLVISGSSADLTVTRRVGVGVTSPSYPLHVKDQGLFGVDFANGWYLNPSNLSIYAGGSQTITKSAASLILGGSAYTAFIVNTSAGYTIRTDSNGQVNIGSSAPLAKLQVKGRGTTSSTNTFLLEDSAGTDLVKVTDDGAMTLGVDGTGVNFTAYSNTAGRALTWNKFTSALSLADNSAMKFGTGGDFNIAHNGSNTVFTCINGNVSFINYADDKDITFTVDQGGTTHQLMTLDGSANSVGIGTTTPSAKLNVKGIGTSSATTALLVEDSSGSDLLEVDDQGNVAIPNGSLSLNGATDVETFNILGNMFFDGSGTISAGGVGDSLTLQAQSANIAIGYPGAADITMTGGVSGSFSGSFEGDGSNLTGITAEWDGSHNGDAEITGSLTISGSSADLTVTGKVGIGTSSPSAKLDVRTTVGSVFLNLQGTNETTSGESATIRLWGTQFNTANRHSEIANVTNGSTANNNLVFRTNGSERMRIDSAGNVGIGTTNPSAKLDVDGNAVISGSLELYNGALLVSGSNDSTLIGTDGEIEFGFEAQPVRLNRNKYVLVNSGTAPVAVVDSNLYLSAHFDYVIVKGTNLRAGTVMACHDGLSNVVYTETATADLGSTTGVTLAVAETGGNLELQMTVPSTGWLIKTFVRAI